MKHPIWTGALLGVAVAFVYISLCAAAMVAFSEASDISQDLVWVLPIAIASTAIGAVLGVISAIAALITRITIRRFGWFSTEYRESFVVAASAGAAAAGPIAIAVQTGPLAFYVINVPVPAFLVGATVAALLAFVVNFRGRASAEDSL